MKHKSYFPPGLASTHTCSCADRPRSRSSWEAMAGTAWCRERPAPEKLSVLLKPSRTERGGARGRRGLNGAGGGGAVSGTPVAALKELRKLYPQQGRWLGVQHLPGQEDVKEKQEETRASLCPSGCRPSALESREGTWF